MRLNGDATHCSGCGKELGESYLRGDNKTFFHNTECVELYISKEVTRKARAALDGAP